MPLEDAFRHLDWGSLYVASEWVVRIAALIYVPQRRPPSAARAWLLLIFFLPWPGVVLYLLICLLYTSPSPRDISGSRMPSSA